jgi:hypothetical protein
MAALPDASGVVRVTLQLGMGGQPNNITRFFIHYTGTAPSTSDLNTFATAIRTAFGTNLKSLMTTAYQLTSVTALDLSTTSSPVGSDSTAVSGTRAGANIPASAAVVTSYKIARRYRGGHPRGYWPFGVTTDLGTEQQWGSSFTGSVKTGIDAFYTAVLAAGWSGAGTITHVNVSYFHGSHVVIDPVTGRATNVPDQRGTPVVDNVTSVLVPLNIGTQRRRILP